MLRLGLVVSLSRAAVLRLQALRNRLGDLGIKLELGRRHLALHVSWHLAGHLARHLGLVHGLHLRDSDAPWDNEFVLVRHHHRLVDYASIVGRLRRLHEILLLDRNEGSLRSLDGVLGLVLEALVLHRVALHDLLAPVDRAVAHLRVLHHHGVLSGRHTEARRVLVGLHLRLLLHADVLHARMHRLGPADRRVMLIPHFCVRPARLEITPGVVQTLRAVLFPRLLRAAILISDNLVHEVQIATTGKLARHRL